MSSNSLNDEIYEGKTRSSTTIIIVAVVVLLTTFVLNLPLKKILNSNLTRLLAANKRCPISYRDLEVLYFMPGVEMIDVTIPSSCSTSIKNDIAIKFIEIRFRGFDFAVFGPKASIETNLGKSLISTNVSVGTTEVNLTDIDSSLNLQDLSRYIKLPINLSGNLDIIGELDMEGRMNKQGKLNPSTIKLRNLALNLYSKNLGTDNSNFNGISIPKLAIGPFEFIIDIASGNKLDIKNFVIGKPDSDIHGNLDGYITLVERDLLTSQINLESSLKFSDQFMRNFSILNLLLGPYKNQETNYYDFKIGGTFRSPKPSKLQKN